jgi:hypothetical protein
MIYCCRKHLDLIARATGIVDVRKLSAREEITPAVVGALKSEQRPSLIVIRTDIGMPQGVSTIPMGGLEIKDRVHAQPQPRDALIFLLQRRVRVKISHLLSINRSVCE